MGSLLASALINGPAGARTKLLDARKVAWSDDDLLASLNRAQRTICFWKVDSHTTVGNVELIEGIWQQLPAGGLAFFNAYQNSYSGERITLVDRELLEEANRFPVAAAQRDVEHVTTDPRDTSRFLVYPPNDGTGEIRAFYGLVPPVLALGDAIALTDTHENTLILLTMADAYMKSGDRYDPAKSAALTQEARVSLGIRAQSQVAAAPKVVVSEGKGA
jgi:hypothetical protein